MILTENQEQLIASAAGGDDEAFQKLFEAYQTPIYNFIFRMLGCVEDAADATQEVFVKMYRRLTSLRNPKFFSTWLFSIAKNEAITMARRKKRKNQSSLDDDQNGSLSETLVTDEAAPDRQLMQNEFETEFQRILLELPEIYRMAFVLGVIEGHCYEEVAQIMNCTVGNVKSRVFRARQQISARLEKVYA